MDRWIIDLAQREKKSESNQTVESNVRYAEKQLESCAVDFLNEVRRSTVSYIKAFNAFRDSEKAKIKMYSVSGKNEGFMLFRHHHKMVFSIENFKTIVVTNNYIPTHYSQPSSAQTTEDAGQFRHLIQARVGSLGSVKWCFNGEEVNTSSLVRYYISRFIRESFIH